MCAAFFTALLTAHGLQPPLHARMHPLVLMCDCMPRTGPGMLVNMVLAYKGVVIYDPNKPKPAFLRHSCFMIVSFILFGSFPLVSFFTFQSQGETQGFVMSCVFTTLGMALLGVIKAWTGDRVSTRVNHTFKIG